MKAVAYQKPLPITVIGTASRPQTTEWVRRLGAHHVLDHGRPLAAELRSSGLPAPRYVVSLTRSDQHFAQVAELIAPQGRYGLIDDPPAGSLDVSLLKRKALSLHWEAMFARSLFQTPDMIEQHRLLTEVAKLIDAGEIASTLGEHYGRIEAANLRRAHARIESGQAFGKIVLEGFQGATKPPKTPHRGCAHRELCAPSDPDQWLNPI